MVKKLINIDPAIADALKRIKARDGIPESEQIRRGIELWLSQRRIKIAESAKR